MKKTKKLSIILFISSIFSLIAPMIIILEVSSLGEMCAENGYRNTWIMLPFVLIPLLSLIFGILKKYKKNTIISLILIPIILLSGISGFLYADKLDFSRKYVDIVEQKLSLQIPKDIEVVTLLQTKEKVTYAKILRHKEEFNERLLEDERWINFQKYESYKMTVENSVWEEYLWDFNKGDLFCFYNLATGKYNSIGEELEKNIVISYNLEMGRMIILFDCMIKQA